MSEQWHPKEIELEVIDTSMQIKGVCEKINEQRVTGKKYWRNVYGNSRWLSKKIMINDWELKEEHHSVIATNIEFISDELV